jgi:hypothetical protein
MKGYEEMEPSNGADGLFAILTDDHNRGFLELNPEGFKYLDRRGFSVRETLLAVGELVRRGKVHPYQRACGCLAVRTFMRDDFTPEEHDDYLSSGENDRALDEVCASVGALKGACPRCTR